MRVAYEEMAREFARVLEKKGFAAQDAADAADIFAQNSLGGRIFTWVKPFPSHRPLFGQRGDRSPRPARPVNCVPACWNAGTAIEALAR